MPMATFRTYAEVLRPDHPMMRNYARSRTWRPSAYRPVTVEQAMRAEPGLVLGDVLQRTGGVYETTTQLTPKSRGDIREIAELTSDDELLAVAQLPEVPVALEHLRHVDPHTRIVVGYRLDATPAESPRLRRRLALPPDPRITLHFDEVVFPDTPGRFWGAMHWDKSGPEAAAIQPGLPAVPVVRAVPRWREVSSADSVCWLDNCGPAVMLSGCVRNAASARLGGG